MIDVIMSPRVRLIKYVSEIVISNILSATTESFEYCINPQPSPTAMLVPNKDSKIASNINGRRIYVEEAPINFITLISFRLAKAVSLSVLIININAANAINIAKTVAAKTKVFVRLNNLSIASPEALISLTAGFPYILSIISV